MDCYLNGAPVGRPTLRSPQMVPTRFSPASGPFALTLAEGARIRRQPTGHRWLVFPAAAGVRG
jgi:hypothetical protein